MDRWARVALLIAGVLCPPLAEAFAGSLSSAEITLGRTAFKAARSSDWTRAQSQIGAIRDPLAAKLMQWHRATREDSRMSFEEISVFMGENPDWPSQHLMRQQAEKAMTPAIPPRRMVAWFERFEPLTGEGKIMFSRALLAVGDRQKAHDAARSAWISSKFTPDQEESFLREFGSMLMPSDHAKRLDLLLWAARSAEAARMLPKVDPGLQDLARARMQLRSLAADVDRAVARVPPKLQNDPGLIYERIRWRRMKDRDSEAIELLLRHPLDAAQPSLWAVERQILARRALASGRFREAYRVASAHAVEAGAEFAEAEWLSGWIALRYLNDPKMAKRHFETMYKKVSYPISLARGAYWRGRAAEALGESADARQWYRTAAEHPATYYGQLAAARVGPDQPLPLPPDPRPSADERRVFEASELVAAVRMLAVFQQHELVAPFLANLETMRESASWRALAAALATEIDRPDLAVSIARRVNQSGAILVGQGYPSVPIPAIPRRGGQGKAAGPIEQPLVLAIIRQESGYRTDAISSAGARGLMQLMPRTAQQVAAELNLPYSVSRLITDSDYNLTLGQTYFHSVLDRFEGSYVLALAGYNAGPYRVQQWRAQMGDPGRDLEAIIDWIERIPFNETRNYIQRILEHLQVYRGKINGGIEPKLLEMDLRR